MKNLSTKSLIIIAAVFLLITMVSTYYWATTAAPVSTIFSILVLIFAVSTVVCLNTAVNK